MLPHHLQNKILEQNYSLPNVPELHTASMLTGNRALTSGELDKEKQAWLPIETKGVMKSNKTTNTHYKYTNDLLSYD